MRCTNRVSVAFSSLQYVPPQNDRFWLQRGEESTRCPKEIHWWQHQRNKGSSPPTSDDRIGDMRCMMYDNFMMIDGWLQQKDPQKNWRKHLAMPTLWWDFSRVIALKCHHPQCFSASTKSCVLPSSSTIRCLCMSILCCSEEGRRTRFDGTLVDVSPKLTKDLHNTQMSTYRGLVRHILVSHDIPDIPMKRQGPSFPYSFTNTRNSVHKLWEKKTNKRNSKKNCCKMQQNFTNVTCPRVSSLHLVQLHKGQCARHAHLTQLFYFLLKLGPRHPFLGDQRCVFVWKCPGELWSKSIIKSICMHSLPSVYDMFLYSLQYDLVNMVCFACCQKMHGPFSLPEIHGFQCNCVWTMPPCPLQLCTGVLHWWFDLPGWRLQPLGGPDVMKGVVSNLLHPYPSIPIPHLLKQPWIVV